MDRHDGVEVVFGHVPDHALAEIACHVYKDIDLPELVDTLLHYEAGLEVIGDRIVVGNRLPARLADLGHHIVGRTLFRFFAPTADPGVVDDNACALRCEQLRDFAPDAASRASNHR